MAEPYLPVYINGEILPAETARVSIFDRGFTRGDGVFETLRTYGGRPYKLAEHLARLDHGLEVLRFGARSADLALEDALYATIRAAGIESARVRVQVTRGISSTGFSAHADTEPTVVVAIHPILEGPAEMQKVIISSIRRDETTPLAGVKTLNYIPSILARMEAEDRGADEAVLLNYAGMVAEGCASNVFMVKDGEVITPDLASGVLAGVTRRCALEAAKELGIPASERKIAPALFESADEIFLTSTTKEIVPASHLNGKLIGTGSHEITDALAERVHAHAVSEGGGMGAGKIEP